MMSTTPEEIDALLSRQAIRDLASRYMRGLDRLDRALLRSTFHDDAQTDYGFFKGGPDAFADMAMNALRSHEANHHLIGQVHTEFSDADHAHGEVYFQAYHRIHNDQGEPRDLFICGRYVDRYERRDGEWRFSFRSEVNDWSRNDPASDTYFSDSPDGLRGARAPDDPSCSVFAK